MVHTIDNDHWLVQNQEVYKLCTLLPENNYKLWPYSVILKINRPLHQLCVF